MGSNYTWCNFTRVTHFLSHRFQKDLMVKKIALNAVEGHLWKAQWKEKPNDEGHKKLTMNS